MPSASAQQAEDSAPRNAGTGDLPLTAEAGQAPQAGDVSVSSELPFAAPPGPAETLRAGPATTAAGCGKKFPAGAQPGASSVRQLISGGLTRRYRLHLPTKATTDTRMPLVLNFHGRYSFSEEQETLSGLVPVSDRETFLLVSPDGTGSPTGWSAGATPQGSVDDVQFVSDLLDRLQQEFCVDLSRVYATGYSNGASMASKVGCELSERIAAIAPVGGVNFESGSCPLAVPVIAFHGTADAVVPFAGGRVRGWWYMGAENAMSAWALNNGCSTTTVRTDLAPGLVQQAYLGCFAATVLVISPGAGHHWPETVSIPPLGRTASVSSAELIWTFFSDKQR